MKQISTDSPCLASDGMNHSIMGINPKNTAKITKYLRDNIYSDKILACVREIISNGFDEHLKFDIKRPVNTGIRKDDSGYTYFVRDYAKGLNEQDMREIFGSYANSTKTSNNIQVGFYGLGSKSIMAYTDAFFVDSCFEGTKSTYSFVIGGDEENVSVGHIYKINEEPTTESGLEVYCQVKPEDLQKFSNKIRDFVSLSPYNIEAGILGQKITPAIPAASKKIGDYNFRLLPYSGQYAGNVLFQMGGNTYKSQSFSGDNGAKVKKDHVLVIDIPIGHCSITLSREGFEETAKNDKVFSEIQDILNNLAESDLDQFKTKTVFDLLNDSLAAMTAYQGDFFQTYARNLYKGVWGFVENVQLHDKLLPVETKNGKPICTIIPDNDARNYWIGKVKGYLRYSNRNIYIVSEKSWSQQDAVISDSFESISARKLPYPKIPKVNGRFAVYQRTRRRVEMIGKFNALELFNHAAKKYDWKFEATTEKEVSDFLLEKSKKVESNTDLERISIRCSDSRDSSTFMVNSATFADKLVSLGFIDQGDQKWREISKKLAEKREKEQKKEEILRSAKKSWIKYGPKTHKAIEKVRHADRVGKFWKAILLEDSLRSKILKKIGEGNYYNSDFSVERHELRKIMALR